MCEKNKKIPYRFSSGLIKNHMPAGKVLMFSMLAFMTISCAEKGATSATGGTTNVFKNTLPKNGMLVNGKPAGKGWVNLIASLDGWNAAQEYWKLEDGVLHGDYHGGERHNYSYTKTQYQNFELNAVVRMTGKEANSGVCIRIKPTDTDNAPGYQVDMGPGYWGSLWEERRAGMVQKCPDDLAAKLVRQNDWNHYYIMAKDHHIQAWLNGVKTIDTVHEGGFSEGSIGFQLCHGDKHTVLEVKTLSLRKLK